MQMCRVVNSIVMVLPSGYVINKKKKLSNEHPYFIDFIILRKNYHNSLEMLY